MRPASKASPVEEGAWPDLKRVNEQKDAKIARLEALNLELNLIAAQKEAVLHSNLFMDPRGNDNQIDDVFHY